MKIDLVADIGGTNARFAAVDKGLIDARITLPTAAFDTVQDAVEQVCSQLGARPATLVLAVAGPVAGGRAQLTNATWAFDAAALARSLGAQSVVLLNDFHAAALAVPALGVDDLRTLGGPAVPGPGVRAILGPGTGLGTAAVVPVDGGWLALPGEGGHAGLAPADALELELLNALQRRFDVVSWEHVVTGPGLVNLYGAVCEVWGTTPQLDTPEAITAQALEAFDPVCDQTLSTFCNLLGSVAGNLMLTLLASGGVYIAGGMALRLADYLAASQFRRRFEERGPMSELARTTATLLVTADDIGLRGALAELRRRQPVEG